MLEWSIGLAACLSHWQIQSCRAVSEDAYETDSVHVSVCMLACLYSKGPDKVMCLVSMLVLIGC